MIASIASFQILIHQVQIIGILTALLMSQIALSAIALIIGQESHQTLF